DKENLPRDAYAERPSRSILARFPQFSSDQLVCHSLNLGPSHRQAVAARQQRRGRHNRPSPNFLYSWLLLSDLELLTKLTCAGIPRLPSERGREKTKEDCANVMLARGCESYLKGV